MEVLRRADVGINIGYAIIYEAVRTITQIYPEPRLLEEAAKCVSRFVTAEKHDLKYLGINALANIVLVDSKYALEHQLVVIDCLEDPDEALRRKTLDLLYKMTNPTNVVIIVDKLVSSLKSSIDVFLRKELVMRITQLAERFAPNTRWYIDIMNVVFEEAGDLVEKNVANNLMKLILESEEVEEESETDVKAYAAEVYIHQSYCLDLGGIWLSAYSDF
jgi:AP-4 complex subunit epsilon-1